MGEELKKVLEEEKGKPPEKPAERHVGFELPPEVKRLPDTVEKLANDFKSFRDSISKTIESLRPEERVPCPGCETPIPKSKAEEVRKRLEEKAPIKEVVREVPKVETRVEAKPITHEHFAKMMDDLTKEKKWRPEEVEAAKRIHSYMVEKGLVK